MILSSVRNCRRAVKVLIFDSAVKSNGTHSDRLRPAEDIQRAICPFITAIPMV
jgi:hypothetical protein